MGYMLSEGALQWVLQGELVVGGWVAAWPKLEAGGPKGALPTVAD